MNYNNSTNENRDLLIAALNKNQVAFAQVAKVAETIGSGSLKIRLNETGKSVIMEYLNKKITIDLARLKIDGVKYLNELDVDDIMTKSSLQDLYDAVTKMTNDLENKADKDTVETRFVTVENKLNALDDGFKTYKITTKWRANLFNNSTVYFRLGYIKADYTAYKGSVGRFEIQVVASNNYEQTVFESAEVVIGHVMEGDHETKPPLGLSAVHGKINDGNRKIGLGLVDVNGDCDIYEVDLILSGNGIPSGARDGVRNDFYRVAFNITCELDEKIKFYEDVECTTEKEHATYAPAQVTFDDYAIFTTYAMTENTSDNEMITNEYTPIDSNITLETSFSGNVRIAIDESTNDPIITFINTWNTARVYLNNVLMWTITSGNSEFPELELIDSSHVRYINESAEYDVTLGFSFDANTAMAGTVRIKKYIKSVGPSIDEYRGKIPTIDFICNWLYPVGSIYTSMNPTNPALLFGGTWERIVDKFLYCADGSSMKTGGSKKIMTEQLPAHTHTFKDTYYLPSDMKGYPDGWDDTDSKGGYWRYGKKEYNDNDTTYSTGNGEDYMPPYMTVFAWYRVA